MTEILGNLEANVLPTLPCKVIVQKEMLQNLLLITIAKNTTVGMHDHTFPSNKASGAQSILKKEPKEHLMLMG